MCFFWPLILLVYTGLEQIHSQKQLVKPNIKFYKRSFTSIELPTFYITFCLAPKSLLLFNTSPGTGSGVHADVGLLQATVMLAVAANLRGQGAV